MGTYINSLGEFFMPEPSDAERRASIYASCACIDVEAIKYQFKHMPQCAQVGGAPAECEWCGAPFEKRTYNQRFCSDECSKQHHNARTREIRRMRRAACTA